MLIYQECDKAQKDSSETEFSNQVEPKEKGVRVHSPNAADSSDNAQDKSSAVNTAADALMTIGTSTCEVFLSD